LGSKVRGKRDGTGPYKNSYQKKVSKKGKRELKLGKCEKKKK
jgi:hypothetical protein